MQFTGQFLHQRCLFWLCQSHAQLAPCESEKNQDMPVMGAIAHLLHQIMATIGYIVKRQWSVKWVPNQRTAAYFTMKKKKIFLYFNSFAPA